MNEKGTLQRSLDGGHSAAASQRADRGPDCAQVRPERGDILGVEKQVCWGERGRANPAQALGRRESHD
jgi:hypothetical protein